MFLGDKYYTLGVGGLHSVDGAGCWEPAEGEVMCDVDVASYYPNIILTHKLEPEYWQGEFLPIYKKIVDQRLQAKAAGDKTTADVLKIVINGSFGKFGDKYSAIYDQRLLAHVTVYGQLGLLALIAMLEDMGHRVVSANTDGVTVISKDDSGLKDIVSAWEHMTGLTMEYTPYKGLYQTTVNDYIAITTTGAAKVKGDFIYEQDLRHMPNAFIVTRAVADYLKHGLPVSETIRNHTLLQDFLIGAQVRGAWKIYYGEEELGKIARFYKSTTPGLPTIKKIPTSDEVKGNAGILPNSVDSVPLPNLPEGLPADLDYAWYIDKANELLTKITTPKIPGMNRWAEELSAQGLQPNIVETGDRLSRANVDYGTVDFASIPPGHELVVRTGEDAKVLAMVKDGITLALYGVPDRYPAKTRDKILKDHGFTLIYGGSVPMPVWGCEVTWMEAGDFDDYYTQSERNKVGK